MRADALGLDFKLKYNKTLKRQDKAEAWINKNKPSEKSREYKEYMNILAGLNRLITPDMTHSEIVGGFEID